MQSVKASKDKAPKPKYNLWQNSAWMIGLAWKHQQSVLWLCLICAALGVALNALNLVTAPVILGAIEQAVSPGRMLTLIALFAGMLMLVHALSNYFGSNTLFGRIELRAVLTADIHQKFMCTSYPNTGDQDLQKKLDRAKMSVSGNSESTEAIWRSLMNLVKNCGIFAVQLAVLSYIDLSVAAVVLVTSLIGFFINRHINGWGFRHRDEEAEHSRRMAYVSGRAADPGAAKDIRAFGMKPWLEDMYESAFRLYKAFIARGEKVYIWANIVDVLTTFLRNGYAYLFLFGQVLGGELAASQFLLYFSAVGGFAAYTGWILGELSTLHIQSLDISTLREFLEFPEPFAFEEGEALAPDPHKSYEIELRNVSFRYPGAESDTLKEINLTIRAGEKLAVVGLNGAGKTTLVKLICGFLDPSEGAVLLNGADIRRYNRRDIYRHFSAVFQDFSLLAASIAENIAQTGGQGDIDRAKLERCVRRADLQDKFAALPDGLDTQYGRDVYEDGIELSGGQIQRLMLARALYKDAPILLLDEPTAALDPIAERDMYMRYHELTAGKTSVYISHRLASTRFCDRIILIGDNRIAEEGTHDNLVALGGAYAGLFAIQSKYYQEGSLEENGEDIDENNKG